ncbi:MAG: hypothetical protein FWH54_00295 [Methanobrevibacter sp.]|nr:hypothetical protein [Methanobrevibacter sp.]
MAEVSTTEISKSINPDGFDESKIVAKKGGSIAVDARKNIENESGKKVISKQNRLFHLNLLILWPHSHLWLIYFSKFINMLILL